MTSTTFLSKDETAVENMCCGDAECERCLAALINLINAPRTIGANRCFSYLDQVLDDLNFNYSNGFMDYCNGKIRISPETWNPHRFVPITPGLFGWYGLKHHAVMRVRFNCSQKEALFDIGSDTHLGNVGGDDHWFFPGEQIIDASTGIPVECTREGYTHGREPNSGD